MTTTLVKQQLESVRVVGSGQTIEDVELQKCTLVGSSAVQWDDLNPSLTLRRISATRCTLDNCTAVGVHFEDIVIDHLAIKGGALYLNGCTFSHVKISGPVGPLMAVPPMPRPGEKMSPDAVQAIVDAYKTVDWALDISEAEFTDASFDYVPGDLVRRDPDTQFVLRREGLAGLDHRSLPAGASLFLSRFDTSPFDSLIAIAPKRSRQFGALLEILQGLRAAGIAE